jgi:hypothetical protein
MSKSIDISSVLNQFDLVIDESSNQVRTLGIRYITASGKVGEIFDARKNVKNPMAKVDGERSPRSKQKYHLKEHGAMKLYNENSEEYRDIKVAHMIEFRPFNSKKWIPIYH